MEGLLRGPRDLQHTDQTALLQRHQPRGNGHDGDVDGAILSTDRFDNAESAYFFNGDDRIFPADPTKTPRHPSQLYEALGEGILLFLILSWFARKPRLKGEVSGLFLLLYGTVRFLIEFVRQPDTQFRDAEAILEIFNWMTRGQWLCVPMMIVGLWLIRRTIWSGFEESADGNESQ